MSSSFERDRCLILQTKDTGYEIDPRKLRFRNFFEQEEGELFQRMLRQAGPLPISSAPTISDYRNLLTNKEVELESPVG